MFPLGNTHRGSFWKFRPIVKDHARHAPLTAQHRPLISVNNLNGLYRSIYRSMHSFCCSQISQKVSIAAHQMCKQNFKFLKLDILPV
ncbi:hypothetical protein [Sideroxydans sp. CL21]|nr:hypothetical protein [Sideroxydans sp. CL21]